jgi:hypothetical protein
MVCEKKQRRKNSGGGGGVWGLRGSWWAKGLGLEGRRRRRKRG